MRILSARAICRILQHLRLDLLLRLGLSCKGHGVQHVDAVHCSKTDMTLHKNTSASTLRLPFTEVFTVVQHAALAVHAKHAWLCCATEGFATSLSACADIMVWRRRQTAPPRSGRSSRTAARRCTRRPASALPLRCGPASREF